jgi:hypothetical protein
VAADRRVPHPPNVPPRPCGGSWRVFRPGRCQAHAGGAGGGSGGQSRRGRFLVAAPPVADLGVSHPARPLNPLPPALPQPGYRDITQCNNISFPITGRARCASTQSRARRDARSRTPAAGRHAPHRRCRRYRGSPACRLHRGAELIEQSHSEPRRLDLARLVLQTADGRLRSKRRTALRTSCAVALPHEAMLTPTP